LPLPEAELREIVANLATRPGHEPVRRDVQAILIGHLGASRSDVKLEKRLPEVHGRLDALLCRAVFEFKKDLRREKPEAERQLGDYLRELERRTGDHYVGVATDGAEFIPYELRRDKLVARTPYKVSRTDARGLALWLSPFVATRPSERPDPEGVRKELGKESLVFEVAEARLRELWNSVREHPEVALKRKLWADRLQLVYGTIIDDDTLFFQHTYLTIVAKTMATLVLGVEIPEPADLMAGRPFQDAGIDGVVESDFFDWVLATSDSDDLIRRIAAQVARFRLGDIEHDVLKGLYESLIDPQQRHDLGEYYTPDWLASRICTRVIENPLAQRVLDPSCGSGTFLFHAVRRLLAAADAAGLSNRDAIQRCTGHVMGIDVHPVAVINARITYLLAIGENRLRDRPRVSIPVYLGDSMQWNTSAVLSGQEVRIDVPEGPPLLFPIRVAQNPALFDSVINEMLHLSETNSPPDAFDDWMERQGAEEFAGGNIPVTLVSTYARLAQLRRDKRNHIWGYVARNLSRPVWLAAPGEKVNVLVGNPPWLSYRYMSDEMQRRFKAECKKRGMWAGGKVATHQDLSAYFFARCMELYLRTGGKIAFVMPFAALTRQQYRGFVTKTVKSEKGPVTVAARKFTEAWLFDESVKNLFNVPSCVLFAENGEAKKLPTTASSFSGELPSRDPTDAQANRVLTSKSVPWPTASESSSSGYASKFRQGATVVPRSLFVVIKAPSGRFGSSPDAPIVESRKNSQEKEPWKSLPPLNQPVEKEFLRQLYLGESLAPFRLLEPALAIIPWSKTDGLLSADRARERGFSNLARWMKQAEDLWAGHGRTKISLQERLDYFGGLSTQMPPAKLRVIYSASGTLSAAARLQNSSAIVEHSLYWTTTESKEEALFLIGVLNSETLRKRVESKQAKGQWGARHFDKLLSEAPIPEFDPNQELHLKLAGAAAEAEKIAASVSLGESTYFIRARQHIRAALRDDGIAQKIDKLVEKLLAP
jgi:hypothetical protein